MKTEDLLAEISSLPTEEGAAVADMVLKSLSPTDDTVDSQWRLVAQQRVKQIKSGQIELIPGEEVFKQIQKRFQA